MLLALAVLLLWAGIGEARLLCVVDEASPAMRIEPRGNYAVAVSEDAYAQPEWREVVLTLCEKYEASLVVFPAGRPQEALPELRRAFPAYVCFVAPPEACGRAFVAAVHRLTRELDDDPYGDVLWGILTGYDAGDALRMARLNAPLVIRRGATSMGPGLLERLEGGFASNEAGTGDFWTKEGAQTAVVHAAVSPDAARALAEAFNTRQPDVFYTSGHATENDWQIAYSRPGGAFRHKDGNLFAQSTDGTRYPICSPNTKVYLPVGNCLIGHVGCRDCMATAWMHSGGVGQMLGYTSVTFYGYMGWGAGMLFEDGRLSLAEAFFLNNQSLIHQLATRFPDLLSAKPETRDGRDTAAFKVGSAKDDWDALGLLWDRDAVAFYGDPAWVARSACASPDFAYRLEEEAGCWTLRVTVRKTAGLRDPKWGVRPFMTLLPERVGDVSDVACDRPVSPVVTDRFVLVPMDGAEAKGAIVTVRFRGNSVQR